MKQNHSTYFTRCKKQKKWRTRGEIPEHGSSRCEHAAPPHHCARDSTLPQSDTWKTASPKIFNSMSAHLLSLLPTPLLQVINIYLFNSPGFKSTFYRMPYTTLTCREKQVSLSFHHQLPPFQVVWKKVWNILPLSCSSVPTFIPKDEWGNEASMLF